MTFNEIANVLNAQSEADILEDFNTSFAVTSITGKRYFVARWLVEDIYCDGIEFMSQEFFEELHMLLSCYEKDPEYFGEDEISFYFTGETL